MSYDSPDLQETLHVLLFERDATTRRFLHGALQADGIAVTGVANIEEAVQRVRAGGIDVVLGGAIEAQHLDLVASVREEEGDSILPILLLSAARDPGTRYRAIAAGADEVLPMPVDLPSLLAAIRARAARAGLLRQPVAATGAPGLLHGQLRRGDFLGQLGVVLRGNTPPWQVLLALRLDQGQALADQLGQAASFELEQALASRFAEALQPGDAYTLWMEFGFGLLAVRDSREEVEALARELCECVAAAPIILRGQSYALTLSVGVALAPMGADAEDADRWFASAYAAQAIAHRLGGNRFEGVLSREYDMPPERVLIIREWVKEASTGGNVVVEFQPVLPLQPGTPCLYALDAKLRDYRAPLAGVRRREYLQLAREAGSLAMIERMGLFNAFEAVDEERAAGRDTRVLVPLDLASLGDPQLLWLEAELRRRRAHATGVVMEFDAALALSRPEFAAIIGRLEPNGVLIAISGRPGALEHIRELQRLPATLLRLPVAEIEDADPEQFAQLMEPWFDSGRGLIADGVAVTANITRLIQMGVTYIQGDAIAAGGPRLDYPFAIPTS